MSAKGGYVMNMVPQCGQGGCGASIVFSKTTKTEVQSHQYFASGGRITATSLTAARVDATFGTLGTMTMTFTASRTETQKRPKKCSGSPAQVAVGRVAGTFRLKADNGVFKTVSTTSLPASVSSQAKLTCALPEPARSVYFGSSSPKALAPTFYASRTGSRTTITATGYEQRGGVRISHTLSETTSDSHLVTAADFSSVTLEGAGALTGSASAKFPGLAAGTLAPLAGDLTGHFDSGGEVGFTGSDVKAYYGTATG